MTTSPFDTVIDRSNTGSIKWHKFDKDVIPMWVADMEFATPDAVTKALHERIDHPILGYTTAPDSLVSVVNQYCLNRHSWSIDNECLSWVPGVLPAITALCQLAGQPGDEIISFPPVYHPLLEIPIKTGRKRIDVPMLYRDHTWHIDFASLENAFTDKTAALLLSSPHNPMGIVFTEEELYRLAALCTEHNVMLVSDEIHCDLILNKTKKHIPTALAAKEFSQCVATIMSPSKTFNLAGANCSFAHIARPEWLEKFNTEINYTVPLVPTLSYVAAEAAYSSGWEWHEQLISYLRGNHAYLVDRINNTDGLSMDPVDATYLAWIDTRKLGIGDAYEFFKNAGTGLSPGSQFGDKNYQRLNFACSRSQLESGVSRMIDAVNGLHN